MQVILTSYRRPEYLRRTVASLRQDDIELFIVDGGSDAETVEWIRKAADGWLLFQNNPGADFLKTEGIKAFATEREFLLTADDLLYPAGYSQKILDNYRTINRHYPRIEWSFCACQMPHQRITQWKIVNGIECRPCLDSQISGAIIDLGICRKAGYFPNYGRTGQGDFAFNRRLEALGIMRCYWRDPSIEHIGANKPRDYPELHAEYVADKKLHMPHGRADDGQTLDPGAPHKEIGHKNG
jgi:glycosyltransferase involved in cell wall biosynthesis